MQSAKHSIKIKYQFERLLNDFIWMSEHLNQKSGSNTFLVPATLFFQITKQFSLFVLVLVLGLVYWGSFNLCCCLSVFICLFSGVISDVPLYTKIHPLILIGLIGYPKQDILWDFIQGFIFFYIFEIQLYPDSKQKEMGTTHKVSPLSIGMWLQQSRIWNSMRKQLCSKTAKYARPKKWSFFFNCHVHSKAHSSPSASQRSSPWSA